MRIDNLFNLSALGAITAPRGRPFGDSVPGITLARHLEAVDPRIFEKKYPALSFVNSGITVNNTGGFVQQVTSLRQLPNGSFRLGGDSASDKGKITIQREESSILVGELTSSAQWTKTDVEQAALAGSNLVNDFMAATNKIYMTAVDSIGYMGLTGLNAASGLLNYAGMTSAAAGGAIGTLTAQEAYDEIKGLIIAQRNAVNNTPGYACNRVVTTVTVMNTLQSLILNTAAGSASVLSALQFNFPDVEFVSSYLADDGAGTGVSATVAYSNSDEVMQMRIPHPLEYGDIVQLGSFDYKQDYMARIAGLDVLESTGLRRLTGL